MKRNVFWNLSVFLFLWLSLFLTFNCRGQQNGLKQNLDSLLSGYHNNQQFSGTVLVAQQGKILYTGAFGFADKEKGIVNGIQTKYLIGSATKSFTAIAVMQAWEKGLLKLHLPIANYVPGLNEELGKLTLHHLMKNTSGLPVHLNRIVELQHRDISSKELVALYNTISLSFVPGSQYEYSNLNYQLAAIVLEHVTGVSYKEYLEHHIFEPLGMHGSGVERTFQIASDKAQGYDLKDKKLVKAPDNYVGYAKGGGDVYSTVLDIQKWDMALYSDALLGEQGKTLLFEGDPEQFGGYGYGFKVKAYQRGPSGGNPGKLVRHGGSMYGYICNIHRYLDDRVLIVVLGNMRPYPTMEITLAIEDLLRVQGIL